MDCPKCKAKMKVAQSYEANSEAHTARLICATCDRVCTSVTFMVYDEPQTGNGAYALSKKIGSKEIEKLRKSAMTVFDKKPS